LLTGVPVRLSVGDDWAEDHHDIEVMDQAGTVLAKRRLAEGVAGMTQLHALTGRFLPEGGYLARAWPALRLAASSSRGQVGMRAASAEPSELVP
jgi:hypothetical protein